MSHASIARDLMAARREARLLDPKQLPAIANVDDAYGVQTELAALAGGDVRGWKVTALTRADQDKFSSSRAVAGMLLGNYVHPDGATLRLSGLIAPLLECEIAFVLGADLPARTEPYARDEVEAAIAQVVAAFEIPDGRTPDDSALLLKLADCMNNGEFIAGQPIAFSKGFDVTNIDITLAHNGKMLERGSSARILNDPLLAVLALANAQPLPAGGLRKGQVVTTGTCTNPIKLEKGEYTAEFGSLGSVRMTVV
jgi:2-keto-4-pentenoate hydratase